MTKKETPFEKYILICDNERCDGRKSCGKKGHDLKKHMKDLVKARGLHKQYRVSRTGCLDLCSDGPVVLLMPDNVYYKKADTSNCDAILGAIEKGR